MPKNKSKKPALTFKQKLNNWFINNEVLNNQNNIITFLQNKNSNFDDLNHNDESVIFWSSRLNYKNILTEALNRAEAADVIDAYTDDQYTALSICAYFGYHELTALLLDKNASIEVIVDNGTCINAYESLGLGYWRWPMDAEDYKKAFKILVTKDPSNPDRQFFSDKYDSTNNQAYLACLRLHDQIYSEIKDAEQQSYNQRDILRVEDAASRRFFRFDEEMRQGGVAKALEASLLNGINKGHYIPLDGYAARSVIIALVKKMQHTTKKDIQMAVAGSKKIFSIKFMLGATVLSYEWRPQKWQGGNCIFKVRDFALSFGKAIANDLERLTDSNLNKDCNDRTKKLGELFLKKTKELQPFRHHEFTYFPNAVNKLVIRTRDDNEQGATVATLDQAQTKIYQLNGLLVLWGIVEPTRRLSGHQARYASKASINIDHIPVATMQIRALQLLSEGIIAPRDVFGESKKYSSNPYNNPNHNAEYGVSTGKDLTNATNFNIVKEKANNLANIDLPNAVLASKLSWFSRNYTKQILREGYGSADESDNEDYSDVDLPPAFIP